MQRSIVGVNVALSGILKTSFSSDSDSTSSGVGWGKGVAEEIRAYWRKNQGVTLTERWYRTLGDDQASAEEWLQAAQNIVRPVDVEVEPSSPAGGGWTTIPRANPAKSQRWLANRFEKKQIRPSQNSS